MASLTIHPSSEKGADIGTYRLVLDDMMDRPHLHYSSTSLPVHGWLHPCRDCLAATSRTIRIEKATFNMCPKCQDVYHRMRNGMFPAYATQLHAPRVLATVEPLVTWLKGGLYNLGLEPLSVRQRSRFVDNLYLSTHSIDSVIRRPAREH